MCPVSFSYLKKKRAYTSRGRDTVSRALSASAIRDGVKHGQMRLIHSHPSPPLPSPPLTITCDCKSRCIALQYLCMCNESNVFILFQFLWGCYGGALVFLGGAGAPASPSLAPPMLISVCNNVCVRL